MRPSAPGDVASTATLVQHSMPPNAVARASELPRHALDQARYQKHVSFLLFSFFFFFSQAIPTTRLINQYFPNHTLELHKQRRIPKITKIRLDEYLQLFSIR